MSATARTMMLLLLAPLWLGAQNLVLNPGFEEILECPPADELSYSNPNGFLNEKVPYWNSYHGHPAIYLNYCGFHGSPPRSSHGGKGFVEILIINTNPPFYAREYIHGFLSEPMEADTLYFASFYLALSREQQNPKGIKDVAMHFSPTLDTTYDAPFFYDLEPHVSNTQYLTDTAWHKAWGCYVAEGGERHLTIGSFTPYEELTWELPPWSNGSQGAHVNIDDVWVMPLTRSGFAQLVRKELCEGQCVRFAHELEGEFSWFFEGGTPATSTLAQPEVCYDSAGTYGVGLVVQHCGGQDSFWFPDAVTVRPLPQPLGASVTVLDVAWGDTVSLEPCVAADHYLWTSDNPIDCTDCPLPALTVLEPDTVWLTAWNGSQADGCTHTCAWVVQVGYPPAAVLSAERRHLCAGECTTFRYAGDEPVQSLEWFFPGGQPDRVTGVQEIEVCYDSAGTYDLGLVAGNAYGFDTLWLADYIQVAPRPWPVGPALQTLDVWEGDTLVLEPCLEGVAGQWRPAEGLSCTQCARPVVVAAESRRYVYEAGAGTACADSCIYELEVSPLEWKVYIPNVFSPNGDGANDLFTAQGPFVEVLELRVYDRWGDLLWRSNGQPWDGTLNGKPLNPGPYAWVMRLRHTRTGEVITRTGVVALVR